MFRPRRASLAVLAVLVVTALLLGGVSDVSAQTVGAAEPQAGTGCNVQVNDPHWSTGGGTVLAKMTWSCDLGSSVVSYDLRLWVCKSKPVHNLGGWYCSNGLLKWKRTGGGLVGAGTLYIPPLGNKVRGCGYWIVNGVVQVDNWGGRKDSPHTVYDCHAP
jgi:hypothetical protein